MTTRAYDSSKALASIQARQQAGTMRDTRPASEYAEAQAQFDTLQAFYQQAANDQAFGTGIEGEYGMPGIESTKNWDALTAGEKKLYGMLPQIPNWVSAAIPDALETAWGPVGKFLAPAFQVAGKALTVLDVGAEAIERMYGLGSQAQYAMETGTMGEFLKDLPAAWKAGTFAYNTINPKFFGIRGVAGFQGGGADAWKPDANELPGTYGLVQARRMFAQGMTTQRVEEALSKDLGALWIRGQMIDLVGHMVVDPLNLIIGWLKPLDKLKMGARALWAQASAGPMADVIKGSEHLAGLRQVAATTAEAELAARKAASILVQVPEEVGLASKVAGIAQEGGTISHAALLENAGLKVNEIGVLVKRGILEVLSEDAEPLYRVAGAAKLTDEFAEARRVAGGLEDAIGAAKKAAAAVAEAEAKIEALSQQRLGTFGRKMLWAFGGDPVADFGKETFSLYAPGASLFKPWTWFKLTPQAKAIEMITNMGDQIGMLISKLSVEDTVKVMEDMVGALLDKRMGNVLYSPQGRATVLALKGFGVNAQDLHRAWQATEGSRVLLERLSAVLKMSDHDLVTALSKGNIDRILADVTAAVQKPQTSAAAALKAMLERGELGTDALKRIAIDFVDGQVPYNKELFKIHMIGRAADYVGIQMRAQLGEQYAGIFEKATSALKAAETLAYLRLNPTYPIRNFLNNELTMIARGVWGPMTGKTIEKYWSRIGFDPARLGQGMGPAELATKLRQSHAGAAAKTARLAIDQAIEDATGAIAKARIGEVGILDKVRQGINNVNLGKADMGVFAATIEAMASRRAYTAGFMEGMRNIWRPGHYMSLEEYVAKYHPGLSIDDLPQDVRGKVRSALRTAMNATEVDRAVLGPVDVSVADILDDAVKGTGFTVDEFRAHVGEELFGHVADELAEPLARGDIHGVRRVLGNMRVAIQDSLDDWADKDYQAIVDSIAARCTAEASPTSYLRVYSQVQDASISALEGYIKRMSEAADNIRTLPRDAQRKAWDNVMDEGDRFFDRAIKRQDARLQGLIQAGRNGKPVTDDIMRPFRELTEQTRTFYKEKQALLRNFFKREFKTAEAREAAWARLVDRLDSDYGTLVEAQTKASASLDAAVVRYVQSVDEGAVSHVTAWRATAREVRRRYMIDVRAAQRQIGGILDEAEKKAAYQRLRDLRLNYMSRIHRIEREGLEAMEQRAPFGAVRGMDPDTMAIYRSQLPPTARAMSDETFKSVLDATGDRGIAESVAARNGMAYSTSLGSYVEEYMGHAASEGTQKASRVFIQLEVERGVVYPQEAIEIARGQIKDGGERIAWLQRVRDQYVEQHERAAISRAMGESWDKMTNEQRVKMLTEKKVDWFIVSAEKGDMTDLAKANAREDLYDWLSEKGYADPVEVRGKWTNDDGSVSWESSYLVLGGRDTDAWLAGQKFGQEAVAFQDGFLATSRGPQRGMGTVAVSKGLAPLDASAPNGTFWEGPDGQMFGFRMDVDYEDFSGTWAPRLRPGRRGRVELVHFQGNNLDLPLLHPDDINVKSGVKAADEAALLNGTTPPRVNYYLADTVYEPAVQAAGKKVTVTVAARDIYDSAVDPRRIVAKFNAEWKARAARGEVPVSLQSPEYLGALQREIRGHGFIGMTNRNSGLPNGVIVWEPLAVNRPGGAKSFNYVSNSMSRPSFGSDYVKASMRQHFGYSEEKADAVARLVDLRAQTWAVREGRPKSEWYQTRLRAIATNPGEGGTARYEAQTALLNAFWERGEKEALRIIQGYGTISPDAAAAILLGPHGQEFMRASIGHILSRRDRVMREGFEARDVLKSYLLTAATPGRKPVNFNRLRNKAIDLGFGDLFYSRGQAPETLELLLDLSQPGARMGVDDFMGLYFTSKRGRGFLDAIMRGTWRENDEFIQEAQALGELLGQGFGLGKTAMTWLDERGIGKLEGLTDKLNGLFGVAEDGTRTLDWRKVDAVMDEFHGIGKVKRSFAASYLGFGNGTVPDSREARFLLFGEQYVRDLTKGAVGTAEEEVARQLNRYGGHPAVSAYIRRQSQDMLADLRKRPEFADIPDEALGRAVHDAMWHMANGSEDALQGRLGWLGTNPLYQADMDAWLRGNREIPPAAMGVTTWDDEYRAVISAATRPTGFTAIHEFGHLFVGDLAGEDLAKVEKWLGVTDGIWERQHHERFANGFLEWIKEGKAPHRELVPVFEQFRDWLRETWSWLRGRTMGWGGGDQVDITDDVRDVFNRMFDPTAPGVENRTPNPQWFKTSFDSMVPDSPRIGEGMDELYWHDGGAMIDKIAGSAEKAIAGPKAIREAPSAEWQGVLKGYSDYAAGRMADAHAYANDFAKMKRDSALLNYHARTYFDHYLGQGVPFGFWTTHSAWNWLQGTANNPKFMADFMRLRDFQQRNGSNKYAPARMQGMWPLGRMPFLPDWMGPMYVDPLKAALPFDTWAQPFEDAVQFGTEVNRQAETILRKALSAGKISQADFDVAMATHRGPDWVAAADEAKKTSQGTNPLEGLSMLMQPHAPLVWAAKAAQGKTDEIGPFLPITSTIKGLTALMGVPGGVNIEGWMRKRLGLPEFDKWEDYRVDRMLSNMAADGSAPIDQVMLAMVNRSGPVFDEAKKRAGQEYGVMKVTSAVGIPFKAWPEGEQAQRILAEGLNKAYADFRAGNTQAVHKFFDEHPEAKARLALFDEPKDRLKTFLVDQVWSQWNAYGDLEKQAVKDALGEQFTDYFLSKETRNYDQLDPAILVSWLKMMGKNPGILEVPTGNPVTGSMGSIKFPPEQIVKASASYYQLRDRYFPWEIVGPLSDTYFKLQTGADRASHVSRHPILQRYWDWRRNWLYSNPQVAPYIVEDPAKLPQYSRRELERLMQAPMNLSPSEWRATLGPALFNLVLDYRKRNSPLSGTARKRLEAIAEQYGMTVEQIIAQVQ
jgi:succinate dehydrogenase flavin-adding protein (antitoxin of CptAB toxin-antitoxin module)